MMFKGFNLPLEGIIVPMVTPFDTNENLDKDGIIQVTEWLIEQGVHGLFVAGSTGEVARLTIEERKKLLDTVLDVAKGKIGIFFGVGCPSTKHTIELIEYAKDAGADAAVVIPPYYYKPGDKALLKHYEIISRKARDYPLIIYDIPAYSGYRLSDEILERIADLDNVVGFKDSSGDMSRFIKILSKIGNKIAILQGWDIYEIPSFILGAPGGVFGIGNIIGKYEVQIYNYLKEKELEKAIEVFKSILPLIEFFMRKGMFPKALKEALNIIGIHAGVPREPYRDLSKEEKEELLNLLHNLKLIR